MSTGEKCVGSTRPRTGHAYISLHCGSDNVLVGCLVQEKSATWIRLSENSGVVASKNWRNKKLQFSDGHCKFSTEKIMGAQNFRFTRKCFQIMKVSIQNFAFLNQNFSTRRKVYDNFSESKKNSARVGSWPPSAPSDSSVTTPLSETA